MKKNIGLIVGVLVIAVLAIVTMQQKDRANSTTTENTGTNTVIPAPSESQNNTPPAAQPKTMTAAEVAQHNTEASCYAIVSGKVYDLTAWVGQHPGGKQAIVRMCGKDGTEGFTRQHGSSENANKALSSFYIADLAS